MLVRFDGLDRYETPQMTLCNPGSTFNNGILTKVVGILSNTSDEEIVFNFNSTSELNFRLNRVVEDDTDDAEHIYDMYKAVQNRRLLFLKDIGYFTITQVEDGYDDGKYYKDVKAESGESEIKQKMIPYIADGTYRFSSWNNTKGLFETIVETLPLWTIGHVDSSVASKYRTFEDVDTSLNCLGFMIDEMQDAYECIFLFDIINRTINVYSQEDYVDKTNIHITKDDLINSIEIKEDADDLYTAIRVLGNDDVMISAVNPIGSNVIYNFDQYLEWMSSGLSAKIRAWQDAVEYAEPTYYSNNQSYYTLLNQESNYNSEKDRLNIQISMYKRCRNNIVAESNTSLVESYNSVIRSNGGTEITIYPEISQTLADIDSLLASCEQSLETVNSSLATIQSEKETLLVGINDMINHCKLSSEIYVDGIGEEHQNFTDAELEELSLYIYEGSYTDDYVVFTDQMTYAQKFAQMKVLYDRSKAQLEKISQPTKEFDVDVENFIFVKDFQDWSNQLETGCLINVELDKDDVAMLFLTSITVNYEDHKLSMKFGNRFNKFDTKSLFEDTLGSISKSANTLSYVKDLVYPIKAGELNVMQEAIQTSRDLTMANAMATDNEEVIFDASGITSRRIDETGEYEPQQLKINGKDIIFTDDGWESSKLAIGEISLGNDEAAYGINAEYIIGDIILGNQLHIVDNNGNDMFTIMDNRISAQVEELDGELGQRITTLEETAAGISMNVADIVENGVNSVTTTTGYTFGADGLHIDGRGSSSGQTNLINTLTNDGMYVQYDDPNDGTNDLTDVLVANYNGVTALNLTSEQYLTIGKNSRFEDYTDGSNMTRTACFYVGL